MGYLIPPIIIHVLRALGYLLLQSLAEDLAGRPDVGIVHHGQPDLRIQQTMHSGGMHGALEELAGLDVLDGFFEGSVVVQELRMILAGEPQGPPHEIDAAVVCPIAI